MFVKVWPIIATVSFLVQYDHSKYAILVFSYFYAQILWCSHIAIWKLWMGSTQPHNTPQTQTKTTTPTTKQPPHKTTQQTQTHKPKPTKPNQTHTQKHTTNKKHTTPPSTEDNHT